MSVFPTHRHASAWASVSPGNNESAGKNKRAGARKGNVHLAAVLFQAALGAAHTKGSYFKDKYFRLRARRGPKRAALAIAHKILVAAYHMLRTGRAYTELGDLYLDRIHRSRVAGTLVHRLQRLGYAVHVEDQNVGIAGG